MMYKIMLIILCNLASVNGNIHENMKNTHSSGQLKNPIAYGVYSAIVPGLGQILNKRYGRGALILLTEAVLIPVTVDAIGDFNYAYTQLNKDANPDYYEYDTANKRRYFVNFLVFLTTTIYILNIFDAVWEAKTDNMRKLRRIGLESLSIKPYVEVSNDRCSFGFAKKF